MKLDYRGGYYSLHTPLINTGVYQHTAETARMKVQVDAEGKVVALNKSMDPALALGEFIGVDRVDAELTQTVFDMLRALIESGETDEYYERAYERLIDAGTHYEIADITGCQWTEIDDEADLKLAVAMIGR